MPAFVRTAKDEARWSKAKSAVKDSRKKGEESFVDQDWALVNHIYHQMHKSELEIQLSELKKLSANVSSEESIDVLVEALRKARNRFGDEDDEDVEEEEPDSDEENPEAHGMRVFDPDQEGEDEADEWLKENDPKAKKGPQEDEEEVDEVPEEDVEEADEPASVSDSSADAKVQGSVPAVSSGGKEDETAPASKVDDSKFPTPSREEIAEMRQYTRPWEQRARETARLKAEAHKNPVLHGEGHILEARNIAHKDRQSAFDDFTKSPEYQNADPVTQMEMETKFDQDWHAKNPDYLTNAIRSHEEAKKKGEQAGEVHRYNAAAQAQHLIGGGGHAVDPMSTEEAFQHAGGEKGEEGTTGAIEQDRAASFAQSNPEFVNRMKGHAGKYNTVEEFDNKMRALRDPKTREAMLSKDPELEFAEKNQPLLRKLLHAKGVDDTKAKTMEDLINYSPEAQRSVSKILGEHPALKDPAKKAKVDKFFAKYYPLIGSSAQRVMNKLGLDPKSSQHHVDALHESGVHGLFQAINDYNHDHPSKASFASHAGNKIRGLMQTTMRERDAVPAEALKGAKQSNIPHPSEVIPKSTHSKVGEIHDRLKRTDTQRAAHGVEPIKPPKPPKGEGEV